MGNILNNIIDFFREKLIFEKEKEKNVKKEKKKGKKKKENKILTPKRNKSKRNKNKLKAKVIEKRKAERKEQRLQKEETLKLLEEHLKRSAKKNWTYNQHFGREFKTKKENIEINSPIQDDEHLNISMLIDCEANNTGNKVCKINDSNVKVTDKKDLKLTNEKNVKSSITFFKMVTKYSGERITYKESNETTEMEKDKHENKHSLSRFNDKDVDESNSTIEKHPNSNYLISPAVKTEDFQKSEKLEIVNKKSDGTGKQFEIVSLFRSIFEEIKDEKGEKRNLDDNWNFLKFKKLTQNPKSEEVKEEIENNPNASKLPYEETEEDISSKSEQVTFTKCNYRDKEKEILSKLQKFKKCKFLKSKDKNVELKDEEEEESELTKLSKSTQTEYKILIPEDKKHIRSDFKDKEIDSKFSKFEKFRFIRSKAEEPDKEEDLGQNKLSAVEHDSMLSESVKQKRLVFDFEKEEKGSKLSKLERFKLPKPKNRHKQHKFSKSTQTEDVSKLSESEIYKIIISNYDSENLDSKLSVFGKFKQLFSKDENIEIEEVTDQNMLSKFTQTEDDSKLSAFKKLKLLSISDDEKRELKEKVLKLDKFKLLKHKDEKIKQNDEKEKLLKTSHEEIDDDFKLCDSEKIIIPSSPYKGDKNVSKFEKTKIRNNTTDETEKDGEHDQNGKFSKSKIKEKFEKFRLIKHKVEENKKEVELEQDPLSKYTQTEDDDDWKIFESEILNPLKSDESKKINLPKSNYSKFSKFNKFKQLRYQDDEIEEESEFETEEEEEEDSKKSQFQKLKSLWTNFEETKEEKHSKDSQPINLNKSKSNSQVIEDGSKFSKLGKLKMSKTNNDVIDKSEEEEEELNLSTIEKLKRLRFEFENHEEEEEEEIKLSKFEKLTGVNLRQNEDPKTKGKKKKSKNKKDDEISGSIGMEITKALFMNKSGKKGKKKKGRKRRLVFKITKIIVRKTSRRVKKKICKNKKKNQRRPFLKLSKGNVEMDSKHSKSNQLKNKKAGIKAFPKSEASKSSGPKVTSNQQYSKLKPTKNSKSNTKK